MIFVHCIHVHWSNARRDHLSGGSTAALYHHGLVKSLHSVCTKRILYLAIIFNISACPGANVLHCEGSKCPTSNSTKVDKHYIPTKVTFDPR